MGKEYSLLSFLFFFFFFGMYLKSQPCGEGIALPLGGGIWPQGGGVFLSAQLGSLKMVQVVKSVLSGPDHSCVMMGL